MTVTQTEIDSEEIHSQMLWRKTTAWENMIIKTRPTPDADLKHFIDSSDYKYICLSAYFYLSIYRAQ